MMAVVALKPGVTATQLKAAALVAATDARSSRSPRRRRPQRCPGVPDLLGPGQKTTTITKLPAGHYGMLCFVPAPDGAPHIAHGMVKIVRRGHGEVEPHAADRRRDRRDHQPTPRSRSRPTGIGRERLSAQGHEQRQRGAQLHAGQGRPTARRSTTRTTYFDAFFNGQAPAGDPPGVLVGGVSSVTPGGIGVPRSRRCTAGPLRLRQHAGHRSGRRLHEGSQGRVRRQVVAARRRSSIEPGPYGPGSVRVRTSIARPGDEVEDARGAAGHLDRRQQLVDDRGRRGRGTRAPAGLSGVGEHDRRAGVAALRDRGLERDPRHERRADLGGERVAATACRTARGASRRGRRTRSCSRPRRRPSCRSAAPCRRRGSRPSAPRSAGVVTTSISACGSMRARPIWMSPVPGGMSMSR